MSASAKSHPLTLKTKLKAWWQGYDIDDLEARLKAGGGDSVGGQKAPPVQTLEGKLLDKLGDDGPVDEPMPWDESRREIAQFVWGEGFCGPGGPDYITRMSKLLSLSAEHSMLDVGASLGGPARVLAHEFGVWVDGLEADASLAEAGMELSVKAGLGKKAPIAFYDFRKLPEVPRRYDRIFSKEALFVHKNKAAILAATASRGKPDSLFLLTDYVVSDLADLAAPEMVEWARREPVRPQLAMPADYERILKENDYTIRVSEDISAQYVAIISQAWKDADKMALQLIGRGEEGRKLVDILMREAEFWGRRSSMLQSGRLKLWRILGSRQEQAKF